MKYFGLFILITCCLSCSAVRVSYDYDKDTDFSNYLTYNYFEDLETGMSELDTKRLLYALDSMMQIKGIQLSEEPDFFINIQTRDLNNPNRNTVGVGVGGTGGTVGGGVSLGIPLGTSNRDREIIFDFVDSQKDELFWQAVIQSSFRENASPSEKEQKLQQIVMKVFARYPPDRGKK
jgi:hypothetical protein